MSDFNEGSNWKLLGSQERHNIESTTCFSEQAVTICRMTSRHCIFFLASDSTAATVLLKKKIEVALGNHSHTILQVPGDIHHIDKSSFAGAHHHLKGMYDWILLARMQYLIISRSGFSETASWLHDPVTFVFTKNCSFEKAR
jgi:hypothetical protein